MPTDESRCRNCGHTFDIVQKMSDDPLTRCPECGKEELRKVFAPPAISFKGSGFYATDHGKKSKPAGSDSKKDEKKTASTDAGTSKKETSSDTSSSSSTTTKKEGSS